MFIQMHKTSFITYFFLKKLQRNSKHVILGNFGLPGHKHLKWQYQFEEILDLKKKKKLQAKNKLHPTLWVFQEYLAMHSLSDTINLQKTFVSICRQKLNFIPQFFWRYRKDMQNSYFRYLGHAWLQTPKMIVSTGRKLWCLSTWQKKLHHLLPSRDYIMRSKVISTSTALNKRHKRTMHCKTFS